MWELIDKWWACEGLSTLLVKLVDFFAVLQIEVIVYIKGFRESADKAM